MLNDVKLMVNGLVRDESTRLTEDEKLAAISVALRRYGRDRPRRKVVDVTSAGGDSLPLPAGWESESELLFAEYPIGNVPPDALSCSIYTTPAGDLLRLGGYLSPGEVVRLSFSVAHVLSDSQDTIPSGHHEALACYAAAWLLEQLAAAAINDGESTIGADTTDRRTKAQEYASRAKTLRARYTETMGGGAGAAGSLPTAGGQTVAWPSRQRLLRR